MLLAWFIRKMLNMTALFDNNAKRLIIHVQPNNVKFCHASKYINGAQMFSGKYGFIFLICSL